METSTQSDLSPQLPTEKLLGALSADAVRALQDVRVPAYIVDRHRRVRWQNAAAIELFGDLRGRLDSSVGIDAEDLPRARDAFTRKLNGAEHADVDVSIASIDGTRLRVRVSTVPLTDAAGEMIGSFGLVQVLERTETWSERHPALSPRERETLALLADGYSTAQMAQEMGIAKETVRNHVKRVLRAIGANSRVEAVAKARQIGLI